ncbi:MAG: Ykof family thiamine-binding protein [Deltaproteobacteria bacterium]|jgi:uncharacterized protein YqgV (UPF0045/DUF77 family)|nr:Ykof family thiamine-binding protein [Deltaproteobacteria bacterium]
MPENRQKGDPFFPWPGCGADAALAGCRFSLYPLSDGYKAIILGSLAKVDRSKIWAGTDALSTVYRGRLSQVFDCLSAAFVGAYREGLHMCLEAQASLGCPGDDGADSPSATDDIPINRPRLGEAAFPAKAKLALYPLGIADYLPIIAEAFRLAEKAGLNPRIIHYATRVEGPVLKVFDCLESVSAMAQGQVGHHVLSFTVSVGSLTQE